MDSGTMWFSKLAQFEADDEALDIIMSGKCEKNCGVNHLQRSLLFYY